MTFSEAWKGAYPLSGALRVKWFDAWSGELDEALSVLPEMDNCPHDLFKLLATMPRDNAKRVALCSRDGVPAAVLAMRQLKGVRWESVMQWLTPGPPAPAEPDALVDAFAALNLEVPVGWWRMAAPSQDHRMIRDMEKRAVHRLTLDKDPEIYWRETNYLRHIKNTRNRCQKLTSRVNAPGAAEWVLRNWRKKWSGDDVDPSLEDRILLTRRLEEMGKHFTVTLHDGDDFIAGGTCQVHKDDMVAGAIYFEPSYKKFNPGVRVIDLTFELAQERGLKGFDMGGGHDYKKSWAPIDGVQHRFMIEPPHLYYARRARHIADRISRKITNLGSTRASVLTVAMAAMGAAGDMNDSELISAASGDLARVSAWASTGGAEDA